MSESDCVYLGDDEPPPIPSPAVAKPITTTGYRPAITPQDQRQDRGGGRTPPHNFDAEENLISVCLLDDGYTLTRARQAKIPSAAFYHSANQIIYARLCEIQDAKLPVSFEVLISELRDQKQLESIGGIPYIMGVTAKIPTTAEATYFISKVRDLWLLRETIKANTAAVEQAFQFTGDIDEFLDNQQKKLQTVVDASAGRQIDHGRPITDFNYPADDDPDILIGGEDFVGRGGALFLVSVTGSGKSPLQLDMCQDWALGRPWHGLRCSGPLKSLIIQHEDSDRYLGKIRGSYAYVNKLTADEEALLKKNVIVKSLRGCTGPDFYRELERLKRMHNPDVIGINPLYLYAEGDISKSEAAQRAITNLEKVNADRHAAYFIVHHTGKPPGADGKQYDEMQDWEAIYMGIGSSYWANWPRGSCFLQPTDETGHYVLRLGKGAMNAGLVKKVAQGAGYTLQPVTHINLKHSTGKMKVGGRERQLVVWEHDGEGVGTNGTGKKQAATQKLTIGHSLERFLAYVPNPGSPPKSIHVILKEARTGGAHTPSFWDEMQSECERQNLIAKVGDGFVRTSLPPNPSAPAA